jgi:DNA adenine methylase
LSAQIAIASANILSRPALRWHGGKWILAPWIIEHFPAHRVYVEPFGGAGSVLLRKPRAYAEVWNDLDQDAVAFFSVLRSSRAAELVEALRLTPFSRDEFNHAYEPPADEFERAKSLVIRSFMGFGSDGHNARNGRTGFRANSNRSGTTPAHDWANYSDALPAIIERLRGVVIENRDALTVMRAHDGPDTLHYVDPPYVFETRSRRAKRSGANLIVYAHEMPDADHETMLSALRELTGMVILSGYPHGIYETALPDWQRVERAALADGARPRTEVLWINPTAVASLAGARRQAGLFDDCDSLVIAGASFRE